VTVICLFGMSFPLPGFPIPHKCGCVDNNGPGPIRSIFGKRGIWPFWKFMWTSSSSRIPTPFKLQFAERMVGSKLAHKPIVVITGANGYVQVCQAWGSKFLNFIVESATVYAKGFFYNFAGAFHPIVVHKDLHRVSQQVIQSKRDTLV